MLDDLVEIVVEKQDNVNLYYPDRGLRSPYTAVYDVVYMENTLRIRRNTEVVYGAFTVVNGRFLTVLNPLRSFFIV